MKEPKITKIKMWVSTAKRNTTPVSTRITIPIPDHQTAINFANAIGQKMKEFESHILQTLAPTEKTESQTQPEQ
jgi:hypothetical protein